MMAKKKPQAFVDKGYVFVATRARGDREQRDAVTPLLD